MARKPVVNKEEILSLLKEGETTQRIAERFNVSRQAIDLHRRDFINRGLLDDKRAPRTGKAEYDASPPPADPKAPELSPFVPGLSLDRQIDLMIDAFAALKRLPQLEQEVERYKRDYAGALEEIERLKENERKRLEQESRWRDAQGGLQAGE
jgi:hypothetical protein